MNILFLSRWFPYPADNGSKLRIYNLLRQLAGQHSVDLISFSSESVAEKDMAALSLTCKNVEAVAYRPFTPRRLKAILGLFSPLPRSVLDTDNAQMHAAVQRAVQKGTYDLVIASEVDMAQYARGLPQVKLLDEIELEALKGHVGRQSNPLKKMRFTLMWKKWEKYIADILRDFDGGTVVSEAEQRLVGGILHKYGCSTPIQIVPNGVDISHYQDDFGKPVPNSLVFTGALTYSANYNAMEFFLGEIYPLIQEKCSSVRLAVTGRLQGVPIERLPARPGVTFTDYLEDVRPTIASSWVSIVPLRIGGGTRLKILESLAIGTPVVSTSKGAEGLELTPDQDILIADTPSEFASAVLRLLADPILRQALSNRGKRAVAARYDWQRIGQSLNEFISQVTGN